MNRSLRLLRPIRPASPSPVFLFTDPNKDPDDLCVLVIAKALQDQGFIDLRCVLTTLGDVKMRTLRAKFAKSVLDHLGLKGCKVGVGVDYEVEVIDSGGVVDTKATQGRKLDHQVFVETTIANPLAVVESDGLWLLKTELSQVPDQSAVMLVNSGLTDIAELIRAAPELVRKKTARVVIMGGIEPRLDARGFVVADQRSYNNTTHQSSADFVYSRLQELEIPLTVTTKEAAYSAAVSPAFYDAIAETGNPIGIYLKEQQIASLKHLWDGINQGHHTSELTPEWFFKSFTDINLDESSGQAIVMEAVANPDDFDAIWKRVSKLNLYDPIALLAATPGAAELLFTSEILANAGSNVRILGKESIKNVDLIKYLISGLAVESLSQAK